ncbi:hypothetical protein [Nonomuraea sp. NPDC050643]
MLHKRVLALAVLIAATAATMGLTATPASADCIWISPHSTY